MRSTPMRSQKTHCVMKSRLRTSEWPSWGGPAMSQSSEIQQKRLKIEVSHVGGSCCFCQEVQVAEFVRISRSSIEVLLGCTLSHRVPPCCYFCAFPNSIQNWSFSGPLINLSIVQLTLFIPRGWDKARQLLWCDWSDSHSRFITSTLSSSSLINTIWSFWRITASPTDSRTSCWTRTMNVWSTVCICNLSRPLWRSARSSTIQFFFFCFTYVM